MSAAGQQIDPLEALAAQPQSGVAEMQPGADPLTALALGQGQQQLPQAAPANTNQSPPDSMWNDAKSYVKGIGHGIDLPSLIGQTGAELGADATDYIGLTHNLSPRLQQVFKAGDYYGEDPNNKYAQGGHIVGNMIGSAPLMGIGVGGGGAASTIGNAMLQGGINTLATSPERNGPSLSDTLLGTAVGGGLGAAGAGLGAAGSYGLQKILGSSNGMDSATRTAIGKVLSVMGDMSPEDASTAMTAVPGKPLTLMDVGGENSKLQRLGRALVTMPGDQAKTITDFLTERASDQAPRVNSDISGVLATGQDAPSLTQSLITQRQAAAKPLYQGAGIPSSPADFTNPALNPVVDTPEVNNLIANSRNIRGAINQAKGNSAYAKLPNNSMVMLDQAYKNIGGAANAARVAGDGPKAFSLGNERDSLLQAITGGDANHPYQQALDAYSGPSQSMDAISTGQDFLKSDPADLPGIVNGLKPADAQFYKIGAAKALQDKVNSAGDNADVVKRVFGNPTIRRQIGAVFGPDAADSFANSMSAEDAMNKTKDFVLRGSQSMNKAGDLADESGAFSPTAIGQDLVKGIAGGPTGMAGAVGTGILERGGAGTIAKLFPKMSPDVAQKLGQILLTPGQEGATNLQNITRPVLADYKRQALVKALTGRYVPGIAGASALAINPQAVSNGQ